MHRHQLRHRFWPYESSIDRQAGLLLQASALVVDKIRQQLRFAPIRIKVPLALFHRAADASLITRPSALSVSGGTTAACKLFRNFGLARSNCTETRLPAGSPFAFEKIKGRLLPKYPVPLLLIKNFIAC
jgi:hypothetical protein